MRTLCWEISSYCKHECLVCKGRGVHVLPMHARRRYDSNQPNLFLATFVFVVIKAGAPIVVLDSACEERRGAVSLSRVKSSMRMRILSAHPLTKSVISRRQQ